VPPERAMSDEIPTKGERVEKSETPVGDERAAHHEMLKRERTTVPEAPKARGQARADKITTMWERAKAMKTPVGDERATA